MAEARRRRRLDEPLTPAAAEALGGLEDAVSVAISDEERDAGMLRRSTVERAVDVLDRAGFVCLRNALDPQAVQEAHSEWASKWGTLYGDFVQPYEKAYGDMNMDGVGTRRFSECVSRGPGRYDMRFAEDDSGDDEEQEEEAAALTALSESGVAGAVVRGCLGRRAVSLTETK